MTDYQQEFISFMMDCGVLTFGDFTTKSGRKTPYFVNTGNYKTGAQAARLGDCYAACIQQNMPDGIVYFPYTKGISSTIITKALHEARGWTSKEAAQAAAWTRDICMAFGGNVSHGPQGHRLRRGSRLGDSMGQDLTMASDGRVGYSHQALPHHPYISNSSSFHPTHTVLLFFLSHLSTCLS